MILRGFTKFNRNDYLKLKAENKIMSDGVNAKVSLCLKSVLASIYPVSNTGLRVIKLMIMCFMQLLGCHGPLANRQPGRAFLSATA